MLSDLVNQILKVTWVEKLWTVISSMTSENVDRPNKENDAGMEQSSCRLDDDGDDAPQLASPRTMQRRPPRLKIELAAALIRWRTTDDDILVSDKARRCVAVVQRAPVKRPVICRQPRADTDVQGSIGIWYSSFVYMDVHVDKSATLYSIAIPRLRTEETGFTRCGPTGRGALKVRGSWLTILSILTDHNGVQCSTLTQPQGFLARVEFNSNWLQLYNEDWLIKQTTAHSTQYWTDLDSWMKSTINELV